MRNDYMRSYPRRVQPTGTCVIDHIDHGRPTFHKTTKTTHHTQNSRIISALHHLSFNPFVCHLPLHTSTSFQTSTSLLVCVCFSVCCSRECACIEVPTGSMYPGVPATRVASTLPSRVPDLSRPKSATLA